MMLSSPHVHTQFCDGKTPAEDMVLAAMDLGFASVGFSSHAKQRYDHRYAMDDERERNYIAEIRRLQKKYEGKFRIWLGTELDLFCCSDPRDYEYTIGSMHRIPMVDRLGSVDGRKDDFIALRDETFGGDGVALAVEYFRYFGAYIFAQRPHIAGHMDLVRKNNIAGDVFDESDPRYIKAALHCLHMIRAAGSVIEVNTGAMARYGAVSPYPARFLLEEWLKIGGDVMLSSDCHDAQYLMTGYAESVDLLLSVGFREALILGRGEQLFERTALAPIK